MYLYLVRHGNAPPVHDDSSRSLSSKGVNEVNSLSDYLLQHKIDKEAKVIFHSGVLRAQQTAEILGKALHLPVEKLTGIQSEDPVEPFLFELETWAQSTLVVSHLPYLPKLIWRLTGDDVQFSTASCVCLKKVEDEWQFEWLYDPSNPLHH